MKWWMMYYLQNEADGEGGDLGGAAAGGTGTGESGAQAAVAAPDVKPDVKPDAAKPDAAKPDTKPAKADAKPDANAKPDESKGYWPEDWRVKASKGDEKLLKRFERYASPEAAMQALIEAQNKISSGEVKASLPKNATEEQVAQWRKDNGIPESPDKYDLTFKDGLVIGDEDKATIDGFLKVAHARNLDNDSVKETIQWYYKEQERLADERQKTDAAQREETIEALREEWGKEYKPNMNAVKSVLGMFPESVRDLLSGGRMADGRAMLNHPDVVRTFAQLAREINPASTVVPAGSGDPMKSIDDEIAMIESKMGTPAYIKDEKMQARYRELVDTKTKLDKKAA